MMCLDVMTNQLDGLSSLPLPEADRYSATSRNCCHKTSSRRPDINNSGQSCDDEIKVLNNSYSRNATGTHIRMWPNCNISRSEKKRSSTGSSTGWATSAMRREDTSRRREASKLEPSSLKRSTMVVERRTNASIKLKQISRTTVMTTKKDPARKRIRTNTNEMCHASFSINRLVGPLLVTCGLSLLLVKVAQVGANSGQSIGNSNNNDEDNNLGMPIGAAGSLATDDDDFLRRQPASRSSSRNDNAFSLRSEAQQPHQGAATAAASSPKFTRINELDVFLDDMSHNELRAVATGKPIGNYLFPTRPLAAAAGGQPIQSEPTRSGQPSSHRVNSNSSASSANGRLDVSQSEQQIYSECALILQRTYVKNIDNPKHQLVPFGKTEQACISYKHIDKAVEQAKHMLKFKELTKLRRKQKPKLPALDVIHKTLEPPQDLVAAIGELNMATTQILANQFDLSNDELLNGLPLIDMSKTKFWPLCPALVKQEIKCDLSRYRTMTGHCNNLKHPTWGAAMTPFARYLPPVHPDGVWAPRRSIITETVLDFSPASPRSAAIGSHDVHESSRPVPVFGEPHLAAMMPPLPPAPPPPPHHMDHLSPLASVQFASHVRPDEAELAIMMQEHASELRLPAPAAHIVGGAKMRLGELAAPSIGRQTSPMTGSLPAGSMVQHVQESRTPTNPYLVRSYAVPSEASSRSQLRLLAAETQQQHHHHHRGHQARSVALDLPSARLVTSVVHRDLDLPNHDLSILFMSWGQLLDHDMTRAAQSPPSIKCCPTADDQQPKHKLCLPIQVPHDDPFYAKHNVQCLEFRRSLAGLRPNCVLGPRVHQNAITAHIDANFVYGSSQAQSDSLRLFAGGRLRDRDWFKAERLKPLLPAQELEPDTECIGRPRDLFCFLAGDVRVNEQTHLTVLHTIYMREHNRLADQLAHLNPHWDDERLFQEARHIVAAGVQHVLINEYIPLLVGKKMADLYNLTAVSAHHHHHHSQAAAQLHWHGYDPSVTTSVANSFAAAAFRQGHTFVQGTFERFNKFHEFVASERLRHLFKRPFLLYQPGVMDELVAGMINQASQSYDPFISEEISGHLFQPPELAFGHDLAAINLQRGREQGLPGYNLFREWCGLPRAESFDQLEPYLTNHTAFHYSRLYKHVDDIDLWSGGVSERKLPGAAIGPTFACIIARQFSNTRRGDRFWYENPNLPSSFTPTQLAEIRKITLAKILCANSDDLPTFQRWALRLAHPVLNPRLPCAELPQMDLSAWQEE